LSSYPPSKTHCPNEWESKCYNYTSCDGDLLRGFDFKFKDAKVELRRHLQAYNPFDDRTDDIGTVELASRHNFGAGFNVGVQWWPCDRMRYGATYRSEVAIDYDAPANFTRRATGNPTFDALVAAGWEDKFIAKAGENQAWDSYLNT
jgi:hypothetical protein